MSDFGIEVDARRDHYPMCVVWSPIPVLSWLVPFIGHTGIGRSDGTIEDFAGPRYIHTSATRTGFGAVTKYWRVRLADIGGGGGDEESSAAAAAAAVSRWDSAISEASAAFEQTVHNLCTNNCHHHVADVLNATAFRGCRRWGAVRVALGLALHAKYVSWRRLAATWLPFVLIASLISAADRVRAVEFFGPRDLYRLGSAVTAAGDVNGDGFDDFVLSSGQYSSVVLVFGRSAEAWASATFNFSDTADPASWIKISGALNLGSYGVAPGDYNGDGFGDVLFGSTSSSYCVYGHDGAWSSFTVSTIGSAIVPGFRIGSSSSTTSVNAGNAGDMNGDGIEDLLVTAIDPSGTDNAAPSVVFGVAGALRSDFDLGNIDGTNGFSLSDGTTSLGMGIMGSGGDINGDGLADLAIGSFSFQNSRGRAYVLFARNVSASGDWPVSFDLSSDLDGTNGFIIEGSSSYSYLGFTVVGAGDVNADGFSDLFIGTSADVGAWIVFGHPAPWTSPLSASQLDGTNGFFFDSRSNEFWGYSVGGAGDVNGDGIADVIIGGYRALDSTGTKTGAAAIIFGHNGSWLAVLDRNDIVGSVGFLIDGPFNTSYFGQSARGAGDVNGDGIADVIVGAPYFDNSTGYAALVFGVSDDHCAVCSNFTNACLVCDDGFFLNSTICEAEPLVPSSSSSSPSSSSTTIAPLESSSSASKVIITSSAQQSSSVVVIITFNETINNTTELQEEIASVLGIDAGLVSVVVISPTEVEVTIIGSEETAQHLVEIINNNGAGSSSGLGLLRKAIDAHIRKDTDDDDDGSSDDGVDAASRVALFHPALLLFIAQAIAIAAKHS